MTAHAFQFTYPRVLSIAGSDSSGGAGIQADLKTFCALGCYGMTAITALTAQSTRGVRAIHAVPAHMLRDQIDAVLEDIGADAVKIGMLHTADGVQTVADAIDRHALKHVVLDAVMHATNGKRLMDDPAQERMVRELFGRVAVITPNLEEASTLVGTPIQSAADMERAARALLAMGAHAVLLKGGHLPGDTVTDVLMTATDDAYWMEAPRIDSPNTHGTGCTLSSAIAAHLALGATLIDAVEQARDYVRGALTAGAVVHTGQGNGPLNHGYAPVVMRLKTLG